MKNTIIQSALELFLTYGFKSVTMDDISKTMGVSKKTIYLHFKNKTELVSDTIVSLFNTIINGITAIRELKHCPIEEIYEINRFVMEHLKNEKSSPQYQLQKYYPEIFKNLKTKQFSAMHDCVMDNLQRGMALSLYRSDIDSEFVARIYFSGMTTIKDKSLFPSDVFFANKLISTYLEYHLRGICTTKGIAKLNIMTHKKGI